MADEMPFIPEFREYRERNKWIRDHATYFTVIRRRNRSNLREERPTLGEAEALAKEHIADDANVRCLIYAISGIHDTLVATVSAKGVAYHE